MKNLNKGYFDRYTIYEMTEEECEANGFLYPCYCEINKDDVPKIKTAEDVFFLSINDYEDISDLLKES